jgi:hypothetical protein
MPHTRVLCHITSSSSSSSSGGLGFKVRGRRVLCHERMSVLTWARKTGKVQTLRMRSTHSRRGALCWGWLSKHLRVGHRPSLLVNSRTMLVNHTPTTTLVNRMLALARQQRATCEVWAPSITVYPRRHRSTNLLSDNQMQRGAWFSSPHRPSCRRSSSSRRVRIRLRNLCRCRRGWCGCGCVTAARLI